MAFLRPAIISEYFVFSLVYINNLLLRLLCKFNCVRLQLFAFYPRLSFNSNRRDTVRIVEFIRNGHQFFARNGHMSSIKYKSLIYSLRRTTIFCNHSRYICAIPYKICSISVLANVRSYSVFLNFFRLLSFHRRNRMHTFISHGFFSQ